VGNVKIEDADDIPTNIQELQEKCASEHLARLKAEACVEKLEVENKKLKDQLQPQKGRET
tara:strand:+ start:7904 stop:8083 length:180 start_codon:yes stop_codon:yes gene_type:complete